MKAPAGGSELGGPLNGRPPAQLLRPALQVGQPFAGLRHRAFRARVARVKRQVGDRQLALLDVDRVQLVGEAAFLEGDARTHAVRRAGGIKIDHGLLRKKMMVLRIRPLRQACAFAVSTISSASPKRLKASGSSSSVKIVALTMPPTITTANGRWVSEPMPWDSAAGNKPNPAISAVIRIGRSRSTAPSTTALSSGLPRRTKSTICSTMITPFCTEIPATAMKPTAAETERCRPAHASPATPPTSVKGTIISTMAALRTERNAQNRSEKIASSDKGTTTRSRAIARCWFSNCPPQVME